MTTNPQSGPRTRSVGGVLEITLGPHSVRNALGVQGCEDLRRVFDLDPPADRRCYLILGEGDTFCSGADLRDLTSEEDADRLESAMTGLFFRIREQPLPIVCWINGSAVGGGAVLAMICDIRLAAPSTRVAIPAMRRGIAIDPRVTRMIDEQIGRVAASKLLLMGSEISGADLVTLGYVHEVVPERAEAVAVANSIAELGAMAVQSHRRALHSDMDAAHSLFLAAKQGPARAKTIEAFGDRLAGS